MLKKMRKTGLVWLWVSLLVIVIDRVSKYWMIHHLVPYQPVEIMRFFNLTLAYNTGAAFSFLNAASGWQNYVLGGLAIVVSLYILNWLSQLSASRAWLNIALCLIIGGAIGNALDRAIYGFVIDFLDFHIATWHFAIFNVADSAICVGAGLLILLWVMKRA